MPNQPDIKKILQDSFDYELFANRLWLPFIVDKGDESERSIFHHVLSASKAWVLRFGGVSGEPPQVDLSETTLVSLHQGWIAAADALDYSTLVEYTNFRGVAASVPFGDIARQAVNHGTYHRGQLRSMFGESGREFPETDFLIYSFGRPSL